ncbi:MAG: acylphosphatase [bacterium]
MAKIDIYVPHRRRVVIHGNVQGIGFRLWLRNVANTLDLVGTCKLLEDGSCEAIVQGERTLVKQFVVACKRGPSGAQVDGVETSTLRPDPSIGTFQVER